jgi:hypothetical protein
VADMGGDLVANKGDRIVVNASRVGGTPREGEIIEVIEGHLRVRYRIRWRDGHESLFAPAAGTARIEPAPIKRETGSKGTEPRKSHVRASTPTKTMAKKTATGKLSAKTARAERSTAKSTAERSRAKKATAKTPRAKPAGPKPSGRR